MTNVLYIYGYSSSPESRTCTALKELLNDANVMSVRYDQTDPEVGLKQLITEAANVDLVIGSSLGGWYTMHVCARLGKPCILINPVIDEALIPTLKRVSSGTSFSKRSIDKYEKFKSNHPLFMPELVDGKWYLEVWDNIENGQVSWVILSDNDEVIKYEYGVPKEIVLHTIKRNIGNNSIVKNGKHRLTYDEIKNYVIPAYNKLIMDIVPKYNNFYKKTYINP